MNRNTVTRSVIWNTAGGDLKTNGSTDRVIAQIIIQL